MHDPREPHFFALKRILRYICDSTYHGPQLLNSTSYDLIAYLDADWVGCTVTKQSTFGQCAFLGHNLLSWSSKCQDTTSRFNVIEAEYRGVANTVAETCLNRNLLLEVH